MRVRYKPSFRRDIRRIRDADLNRRIQRKITEIEAIVTISEVSGIGRLRSASGNHYRVRIGEYRLGVIVEGDLVTLLRFSHRSDFYRRFP